MEHELVLVFYLRWMGLKIDRPQVPRNSNTSAGAPVLYGIDFGGIHDGCRVDAIRHLYTATDVPIYALNAGVRKEHVLKNDEKNA